MPALIIDPALQAAVIRQFNLRGELAPFNLTENVVPVFDIGALTGNVPTVVVTQAGSQGVRVGTQDARFYLPTGLPFVRDTEVFDGGFTINPGAGAVVATTGQLVAGDHLVWANFSSDIAGIQTQLQWRDAADAVTLASWSYFDDGIIQTPIFFAEVALDQRFRWVTVTAVVGSVSAGIVAQNVFESRAD